MAETMESAMHRICDLSQDMDVHLLDTIVLTAYDPMNPQRASANKVLMALKDNPDMWVRADAIMERAVNAQTRFFGLQLLEDVIRVRYVFGENLHSKFLSFLALYSNVCLNFIIDGKFYHKNNGRG